MFNKFILFRKSCCLSDNVERYRSAGQATYENMAHVHCRLDTYGYKNTLRTCNNYCFSTASMVTRTRMNVTLYVHCRSICCQLQITQTKLQYIKITSIPCLLCVLTICFSHKNIHNAHIQYNR